MTRDDIINMAKEAWGLEYVSDFDVPKLERFAALVAKAEREACAELCDAERSEFVQQAANNDGRQSDFAFGSVNSSERIAASIRSRTTP